MTEKNGGWIKLYRKSLDNPYVSKSAIHLGLWSYILMRATRAPKKVNFKGKVIELKPGQFTWGRKQAAEELRVPLSTLRRILTCFESGGLIGQQTSNKCSLLTVLKWELYQESGQHFGQQMANKWPSNGQQMATKQEVKKLRSKEVKEVKEKNRKKEKSDFLFVGKDLENRKQKVYENENSKPESENPKAQSNLFSEKQKSEIADGRESENAKNAKNASKIDFKADSGLTGRVLSRSSRERGVRSEIEQSEGAKESQKCNISKKGKTSRLEIESKETGRSIVNNSFIEPTYEEIRDYCAEKGFLHVDPEYFLAKQIENDWKRIQGKKEVPVKNWKASIRVWDLNEKKWTGKTLKQRKAEEHQKKNNQVDGHGRKFRKTQDELYQNNKKMIERLELEVAQEKRESEERKRSANESKSLQQKQDQYEFYYNQEMEKQIWNQSEEYSRESNREIRVYQESPPSKAEMDIMSGMLSWTTEEAIENAMMSLQELHQ